ncbi:MAG: nucleotidyltransferase domain-containing protein [bacterium]|jgi:predicted nucleotidyltransferase|nr:nucleotidyltransferase domain-containing protein [bacterium]
MEGDDLKKGIEAAAEYLRRCGAREVYLFGSASKGGLRRASDVDLAVEGLPPEVFFRAMGELFRILDRPVDLIDLDEDNPLTRALKEGGELSRV